LAYLAANISSATQKQTIFKSSMLQKKVKIEKSKKENKKLKYYYV